MLPAPSLVPLALIALLLFAATLFVLAALGHFPRAARNAALAQGIGPVLLWGSILVVTICVVIALVAAWRLTPWFAAIIAGGIAILVAPLALQYFSDTFLDRRRGVTSFAAICFVLALALLWYMSA